jgi:colicin import membrane protein
MSEDVDFDPYGFMADVDAGYEGEEDEEVNKLKELGSQLEEDHPYFYKDLGDKKLALRQSPSPIVFEQVAKSEPKPQPQPQPKSEPKPKPKANVVRAAVRTPMVKAKLPQPPQPPQLPRSTNYYYDDADDDVKPPSNKSKEAEANNTKAIRDFWRELRINSLRRKEALEARRKYLEAKTKNGGTRKRNKKRSTKKRSTKKRSTRRSTRRSKRSSRRRR